VTTETLSYTFGAGERKQLPGSRILAIKTAASPVSVEAAGPQVQPVRLRNVVAGLILGPLETAPSYFVMTSAVAQVVEVLVSDDPVSLPQTVAVSGVVATQESRSTEIWVSSDVSVAAGGTYSIAGGPGRLRLHVSLLSTAVGSVRYGPAGVVSASRGLELQPGNTLTLSTTVAMDIYNPNASAVTLMAGEEW